MKKFSLCLIIFTLGLPLNGCFNESVDSSQNVANTQTDNDFTYGDFCWEEDIDLSLLDATKIEGIDGSNNDFSNIRIYNKSLIKYIVDIIKNTNFNIKLDNDNDITQLYINHKAKISLVCGDYYYTIFFNDNDTIWITGEKAGPWFAYYKQWAYKAMTKQYITS